jgi:hypothetical protein
MLDITPPNGTAVKFVTANYSTAKGSSCQMELYT